MQSLSGLLQLMAHPAQGPSPSFGRAHVFLAFITMGESRIIGRQALAARSGLKEGAIRTVLRKLRDDGYAEANASGCFLTPAGRRVYEGFLARFSPPVPLKGSRLTMGDVQVGMAARGRGKNVQSGIEQRDAAIKLNAMGATTYMIRAGKFTIPGGSTDCERDFPGRAWSTLHKELKPQNGDAVVVCGARDETTAKLGALSAVLSLV